ncbi:Flagellar P-ring protein FlgI [hydrothermal vent metagenome]|uniref:Flagellar P-ring protein FlgI n=1 Tax=hydrothermal vent metagenome TaxID=652676 RepID=A0A1W1D342_9ZZZZ
MKYVLLFFFFITTLYGTKISDIANVVGVRDNQLIGYSLVVGLKKTGDGTTSKFTLQSIANMLKSMNIDMKPVDIKSKNVAAVVVTAKLKPFARQGDKFDIVVSSIGDAKSLEGGTLLMTPLKGVDGKIYALAQGSVSIGGRNSGGGGTPSHPTSGMVYEGGIVEREINIDLYHQQYITLSLKEENFKNAVAIQKAINRFYTSQVAVALDPRTIKLKRPNNKSMIEFLAEVEDINIDYNNKNKIIINERTGTIIAGIDIEIKPIILTHGDITIKINEQQTPSQPAGSIKVDNDLVVGVNQDEIYTRKGTTTVANLVRSLEKLGASSKDIIAILEAMKSAGSISADLEII